MDYSGQLELTWTNKHRTLLAHDDGSYEWVEAGDHRVSEVRLLHDVAEVGEVPISRARSNLLIRGDALHGLQSLNRIPEFAREYVGRVRLCYIDPPFNTGQAFTQYDDNLEHSVWLTMLRDRLVQIRPLLAPTGSVWVHLDDAEVHRCRVVLDEVFGTDRYIGTVVWRSRKHPDNKVALYESHHSILVYGSSTEFNLQPRGADAGYTNPDNDPRGPWDSHPLDAAGKGGRLSPGLVYPITNPNTGVEYWPNEGRMWSVSPTDMQALIADDRVWWGVRGTAGPRKKAFLTEVREGLSWPSLWLDPEVPTADAADRHLQNLFGRGRFETAKPEELMQRIIFVASDEGDIVLDCFAGSGSTAAAAHKMGRRWVTIERERGTVESATVPRLSAVVDGSDRGGISTAQVPRDFDVIPGVGPANATVAAQAVDALLKNLSSDTIDSSKITKIVSSVDVGDPAEVATTLIEVVLTEASAALKDASKTEQVSKWDGGGGFRVLDVGPSMFEEVDGRIYLANWAINGALAEATAAQLGFTFESDPPFSGRKGKVRLAVVDGLVNDGVVRVLIDRLPDGERLCVCGTAIDPESRTLLRQLRPGSTMKKVPAALLNEYRQPGRERLAGGPILDWADASAALRGGQLEAGT